MDEEADGSHYCMINEHHHHLKLQLNEGLEFDSPEAAHDFYNAYSEQIGFYINGSRNDDSTTTCRRRFVCSEEACEAFLMVQLNDSGKWVVASYVKDHNHPLVKTNVELETHHLRQCIGNHWYPTLQSYFQVRQAEDLGFYYAFQLDELGRTGSVFWAEERSKFLYTQFGDSIVFDTYYRSRRNKDLARFASFVGVNHHKKPVLLGCALISDDDCEECFTWVFRTWIKAMGGQCPRWIIADQDQVIRRSIARVFPRTRYRFSTWQIKEEEQRLFLTMNDDEFEREYKSWVSQTQKDDFRFDLLWSLLLLTYQLNDNLWLNEMYQSRQFWALPFIHRPFLSDITTDDFGNTISFFGDTIFINKQSPADRFLTHYINVVEHRRAEENEDELDSLNSQIQLLGIHPNEAQCRHFYTNAVFKEFQKEILKCSEYHCRQVERPNDSQNNGFVLYKPGVNEIHGVKFNIGNHNFACTCFMFELKGLLCAHILRVVQFMACEIPSRYILHRWTKNASIGYIRDVDSVKLIPANLRNLMSWSLTTETNHLKEMAMSSFEKYQIAILILDKGRYELLQLPRITRVYDVGL